MFRKPRVLVVIPVGLWWLLLSGLGPGQPRLTERVVKPIGREDIGLFVYAGISQSHFRFIVTMLARSARVPIGFEEVAQQPEAFDGNLARIPTEDRKPLIGLKVGQALDLLVVADTRYAWREQDGVLLIRPVSAWNDSRHYLHQIGLPIEAKQRRALDIARDFYEARGLPITSRGGGLIGDPPGSGDELERPISVQLPAATMLDGLSAIIKSHGQLSWMVVYARGPAELRNSCIRVTTFEGNFAEIGPIACRAAY